MVMSFNQYRSSACDFNNCKSYFNRGKICEWNYQTKRKRGFPEAMERPGRKMFREFNIEVWRILQSVFHIRWKPEIRFQFGQMLVQAYYKSPHYRSGEMFGSSVHVDERVDDINRRDVIGLAAQRIQPPLPTRQVLSYIECYIKINIKWT